MALLNLVNRGYLPMTSDSYVSPYLRRPLRSLDEIEASKPGKFFCTLCGETFLEDDGEPDGCRLRECPMQESNR